MRIVEKLEIQDGKVTAGCVDGAFSCKFSDEINPAISAKLDLTGLTTDELLFQAFKNLKVELRRNWKASTPEAFQARNGKTLKAVVEQNRAASVTTGKALTMSDEEFDDYLTSLRG
jgi:hypothetical protein